MREILYEAAISDRSNGRKSKILNFENSRKNKMAELLLRYDTIR